MERVKFYTLGCKVNQYETQAVQELFESNNYQVTEEEHADIFVINTCTVTNMSDRKSRQMIRRFKRNNPDSIIIVMGCYSQVSPEDLKKLDIVDILIGTEERDQVINLLEEYKANRVPINIVNKTIAKDFPPLNIEKIAGMTRAYIKVQDGCNRYCSYCIIPYARGPIRSRSPEDTISEVERLVDNGFKEVVLTGIHISSYGKDLVDYRLIDLIEDISKVDGIERIRLSSIEPLAVTKDFLDRTSKVPEFCDHFHLSLQSGSESVLSRMNRRYTPTEYKEIVDLIREYYPNCGITTDIIVGFPGETEDEFAETVEFVKDIKFSKVHIFPYSIREGTPAAEMEQVHGTVVKDRVQELTSICRDLERDFLENHLNVRLNIILEQVKNGYMVGHSTNYLEIGTPLTEKEECLSGKSCTILTERIEGTMLIGTDVDSQ